MAGKRANKHKQSSPLTKVAAKSKGGGDRLDQLERLIELMVARDVVEVELEEQGARWRVRRTEPHTVAYAAPTAMAPMPVPIAAPPAGGVPAAAAAGPAAAAPAAPAGEVFKSPMLGTFYRAASPEAEPFCKVGDRVSADRTLCIIEAMKVMNEIKAEREFEVVDILVKNGEPVEFGQPLFLIR
ncbi:MAG: acetyl-CoA carboxylase biotin carboxyl carrier protein [Planctomycetes bacterium]|nr:acetyl-CoA carboxylase biotin carboxyl carrier protein [Planctomycetota bacterium]